MNFLKEVDAHCMLIDHLESMPYDFHVQGYVLFMYNFISVFKETIEYTVPLTLLNLFLSLFVFFLLNVFLDITRYYTRM